ncbi:hypothetical protein UCRPC4_g05597 [Phaeomoniella chlamydospora]|uniref:Up-regulated during septation protein 1 domain-containing protein n=1 Tax=Phaeomoniella chlamydospora TaxID=158046 RepID=A0A0G2GKM1_PHACM|nr:hypothetical protein UCRPC4_g05597 [Phaeomoniella chlamydospora]
MNLYVSDAEVDLGLNNFIARAISPDSPKTSTDRSNKRDMSQVLNSDIYQPPDRASIWPSGRETPSSSGRDTPISSSGRDTPTDRPRYQLWPAIKKAVGGRRSPENDMPLHMSQSVPMLRPETSAESMTQKFRAGSLPRRRKASVPELSIAPMTTVQERPTDSPTIPGRFPVHERSNSVPTSNKHELFLPRSNLSPVADLTPGPKSSDLKPSPLRDDDASRDTPGGKSIKRASSILIPDEDAETILPLLPQTTFNPLDNSPSAKAVSPKSDITDVPPAVPPKSPRLKLRIAPVIAAMPPKASEITNVVRQPPVPSSQAPLSTPDSGISPNPFTTARSSPDSQAKPWATPQKGYSPVISSSTNMNFSHKHNISAATTTQIGSPPGPPRLTRSHSVSNLQRTRSNSSSTTQNFSYRHRREESEGSMLDRGRPTKRIEGVVKRKLTSRFAAPEQNFDSLPVGLLPDIATSQLPADEVAALREQAVGQAGKFALLPRKEVKQLSRELRSLDERCEYLRKTHNSLRDGRRELHARMITYLKSPRLAKFSVDSMLKQEVALGELDKSVDEWIVKLEYAENRRARVRQKLLEHVAAALTLPLPQTPSKTHVPAEEQTPPRSPEKAESPRIIERHEVESIKIYAGKEVHALLADIEQEIENMVEPGYID